MNKNWLKFFSPAVLDDVLDENFDNSKGQKPFSFGSYTDRVKLGKKIIDKLYEKDKK